MVRTTEMGSITLLRPADQRPTMPTTIKQKPDLALLITNKNKRILTHITQAIITRTRDLRLMTHITPSPSKHPLQLQTMNLRIIEDRRWDQAPGKALLHLDEQIFGAQALPWSRHPRGQRRQLLRFAFTSGSGPATSLGPERVGSRREQSMPSTSIRYELGS